MASDPQKVTWRYCRSFCATCGGFCKSDVCVGLPCLQSMRRAFNVILQWLRYGSSLRYIPYCRCSCSTLPLISVFFNLPSLPFLTLGTLTAVRHFISPFDSLANLFAPCIAWTIIFLVSALIVPFQVWRRKVSSSAFRWIDKEEATIVMCLLLAQICSAANGAGKWPHVPQNLVSLNCRLYYQPP